MSAETQNNIPTPTVEKIKEIFQVKLLEILKDPQRIAAVVRDTGHLEINNRRSSITKEIDARLRHKKFPQVSPKTPHLYVFGNGIFGSKIFVSTRVSSNAGDYGFSHLDARDQIIMDAVYLEAMNLVSQHYADYSTMLQENMCPQTMFPTSTQQIEEKKAETMYAKFSTDLQKSCQDCMKQLMKDFQHALFTGEGEKIVGSKQFLNKIAGKPVINDAVNISTSSNTHQNRNIFKQAGKWLGSFIIGIGTAASIAYPTFEAIFENAPFTSAIALRLFEAIFVGFTAFAVVKKAIDIFSTRNTIQKVDQEINNFLIQSSISTLGVAYPGAHDLALTASTDDTMKYDFLMPKSEGSGNSKEQLAQATS